MNLPNLRKLFIPDPGYVMCDADLAGADAQVVAAEAGDTELLALFKSGLDVHGENAKVIGFPRPMAKRFLHGTNYGGSARTMGASCGITLRKAQRAQADWFEAHPGIKEWHLRVEDLLRTKREVRNKFGFRRYYFDRPDGLLPEALAWIPQSTVAIATNHALIKLAADPDCTPLLQVHDSVVFQIPEERADRLPEIVQGLAVPIPYDPPLTIPFEWKASKHSWGGCK